LIKKTWVTDSDSPVSSILSKESSEITTCERTMESYLEEVNGKVLSIRKYSLNFSLMSVWRATYIKQFKGHLTWGDKSQV
jgi:hypothetical protein